MSQKYLVREDAPFGALVWETLDKALIEVARRQLVGRRLLHTTEPMGLDLKAVPQRDRAVGDGFIVSEILPVPLIYQTFTLGLRDVASFERGSVTMTTAPLIQAVRECVRLEDRLVFYGAPGVPGLTTVEGSSEIMLPTWDEVGTAAEDIIRAVNTLDDAGFYGPYSLALAPNRYNLLYRLYSHGNKTELEHVQAIVTDGVYKAPILESGGVLVASGRQLISIVIGQDLSIGFIGPSDAGFEFSVSESLTLRILEPTAICVLKG